MASRPEGSLQVFRIASATYPIFDGGGARRFGSRWCSPGRSIIHTASAYALALLENLVHWNATRLPLEMRFVVATIPATVSRSQLVPETLPGWDRPDYRVSRPYGDAWYDGGETAVLIVPSVLSPFEPNVLINQRHGDARSIELSEELPRALRSTAHAPLRAASDAQACVAAKAIICLAYNELGNHLPPDAILEPSWTSLCPGATSAFWCTTSRA